MTHQIVETWFNGKRGSPACASATVYDSGVIVASVATNAATERQFVKALSAEYPNRIWATNAERGYFIARGSYAQ